MQKLDQLQQQQQKKKKPPMQVYEYPALHDAVPSYEKLE